MVYGSMMFSAIGVVAAPLVGASSSRLVRSTVWHRVSTGPDDWPGGAGLRNCGRAASCLLHRSDSGNLHYPPFDPADPLWSARAGRSVRQSGDGRPAGRIPNHARAVTRESLHDGRIDLASEFPLSRIVAVIIISLVGVVVQPHFIATGGGSAKTEFNARVRPGSG